MNADRSFLYGLVALQAGLINSQHFNELIVASTEWDEQRDGPFTDLLVARRWIQPDDRAHLEYLVGRKLQRHAGDAKAGSASIHDEVEQSLASLRNNTSPRATTESSGAKGAVSITPVTAAQPEGGSRYSLTSLHATGGIGRVWLARDGQMGRDVALKELRPEQADDAVLRARFLREAHITGQLEHPGIVPVYELARRTDTGEPFYTMRFVKGRTLSDAAKAHHQKRNAGQAESLEFATLLNAFVVVCKTIAYAHSRGVIHRDLKGQNVIVGDYGEVVVLDWGLAKLVDRADEEDPTPAVSMDHHVAGKGDLTLHGEALGTPAYMAPEQAAGKLGLIDCRTDVYGLGAMLYQLLTGQAPFSGKVNEVLRKVESEEPVAPQQWWVDVPLTLQAACLRAMAKQSSARFASAGELAQEVEQWQENQRQKAIEALRESEALYHSLMECSSLNVWRKDLEGRFTFVNQGFCEAMALTREELIGKTDYDVGRFAPLAEKYRREDARVVETGQPLRILEDHSLPEGRRLVLEVIKIPIRDAHGAVIGTQGVFWDVAAWKRAQEEMMPERERR